MKPVVRTSRAKQPLADEAEGLERALDKTYSRLRERARAAWERHHAGKDPTDACVSVRIAPAGKATPASPPARKPAPHSLVTKSPTPRKKIRRTKGRSKA
jgi:hypothetical protein